MGGERILWDDEICKRVKDGLLNGERCTFIAEEEGLTLKQFQHKFLREVGQSPRTWAFANNPALCRMRILRNGQALPVNEHYFDNFLENPTEHAAYLLGVLYGRPVISSKNTFEFSSKNETLLDIVQTELEAQHQLVDQNNGVSLLRIAGVPHLYHTLYSLGFKKPARQRLFPDIPEPVLSDFIRGIVEANSGISRFDYRGQITFSRFGLSFLVSMDDCLERHAGVSGRISTTSTPAACSYLTYRNGNVRKVAGFIYRNKEFLEDTGLFVPEIRERLEGN